MRLYVEELRATALVQEFTRTSTALVPKVRLHICKYLSPAGTFIASLTDADDNVLGTDSQTLNDMVVAGLPSANYYHGHVTFEFPRALTLKPGTYKLKLSSSGYTYSDTVFLGWCKAVTDPVIPTTDDETWLDVDAPYDFEMLAYERAR